MTSLPAPLWIWLLAASEFPALRAVDLVGAALFLALQWFWVPSRPPGLTVLALIVLYLLLLGRGIRLGSDRARGRPGASSTSSGAAGTRAATG